MERSSKAHYKHHRQCWNLLYVNFERWASLFRQLVFLIFLIETNQFKRDIRDIQPQSFYHKKLPHSLLVSILHESVLGAQCWLRSRWWEVVSIGKVGEVKAVILVLVSGSYTPCSHKKKKKCPSAR